MEFRTGDLRRTASPVVFRRRDGKQRATRRAARKGASKAAERATADSHAAPGALAAPAASQQVHVDTEPIRRFAWPEHRLAGVFYFELCRQ